MNDRQPDPPLPAQVRVPPRPPGFSNNPARHEPVQAGRASAAHPEAGIPEWPLLPHDGRIGPFVLVRPLPPGPTGQRWLALHEGDETAHLAVCVPLSQDRAEQRRFVSACERLCRFVHPHALALERFALMPVEPTGPGPHGRAPAAKGQPGFAGGAVMPFPGSLDGLVTLAGLRSEKGGRLPPIEASRALTQLLAVIDQAHLAGLVHGPIDPAEVCVDRRGSLAIELYGVRARLRASAGDSGAPIHHAHAAAGLEWAGLAAGLRLDLAQDEIRSVVQIGYELLTGLPADEPRIPAARLLGRLDERWDRWFDAGLNPAGGFPSARAALAELLGSPDQAAALHPAPIGTGPWPSTLTSPADAGSHPPGPVRVMLDRFRRALRV